MKETDIEDMYLLEDSTKLALQIEEAKELLRENGEDPTDFAEAELENMVKNGYHAV